MNASVLDQFTDPAAGPTTPHFEIIFAVSSAYSSINLYMILICIVPELLARSNRYLPSSGSFLTILTALVTPTSREFILLSIFHANTYIVVIGGSVTIQSTNPFVAPLINPNMLDTDFDITTMVESIKAIKRFAGAPAWGDYITSPYGSLAGTTDAELEDMPVSTQQPSFHPTSTASMTSKNSLDGVVNPDLHCEGTSGLRIVDLSVFVSNPKNLSIQC